LSSMELSTPCAHSGPERESKRTLISNFIRL
jgi:hypothetical protein